MIITLNPTANSSPSGEGAIADTVIRKATSNASPSNHTGETEGAVGSPTNNGHAATTASVSTVGADNKTCRWQGFAAAGCSPSSSKVKADYSITGGVVGPSGENDLFLDLSEDGGSSYFNGFAVQNVSVSQSGSAEIILSNSQDLTLVRVADWIRASTVSGSESDSIIASISNVRIELQANISASGVSSPSNTGHGSTVVSSNNDVLSYKTCLWSGFPANPVAQPQAVKLKVDWNESGSLSGTGGTNSHRIEYSLNNGSTWQALRDVSNISGSSNGTSEVTLSNSQNLTQVRVRNRLLADALEGTSASLTVTISGVRLEVDAPVVASVGFF
jgi:hypothetical protein